MTLRITGSPERHNAWARVWDLVMTHVPQREDRDELLTAILNYGDTVDRDASERLRQIAKAI